MVHRDLLLALLGQLKRKLGKLEDPHAAQIGEMVECAEMFLAVALELHRRAEQAESRSHEVG